MGNRDIMTKYNGRETLMIATCQLETEKQMIGSHRKVNIKIV